MGEIFEKPVVKVPLAWTGERLTSGAGPQVEIEHLHRYFLARSLCRDLDVLDVASGEGYGSALLAQTARSIVGVEVDAEAVAHASATYVAPNLRFQQGDARSLPLPDACVDIVVSFETIEHFYDHDKFLTEVSRVLRPGGRAIISSPERDIYSPAGAPANPHHVRELTRAEFLKLLRRYFGHVVLQGQRPILGSALITEEEHTQGPSVTPLTFERRGTNQFEQSEGLSRPVYLLAVVSNAPLENIPSSLYVDTSAIEDALVELPIAREMVQQGAVALAAAGDYAHHVEAELAARDRDLAESAAHARLVEAELAARDRDLAEMQKTAIALQAANAHANELQRKLAHLQAVNASLHVRYREVVGSSSWRITQPLRHGLERHPDFARTLRTSAQLIWWTVTLQLPRRRARQRAAVLGTPAPVTAIGLPPTVSEPSEKELFAAGARKELLDFLASGEQLVFPPAASPDISVVIILWNSAHLTLRCVRALLAQSGVSIELILFDNASTDETKQLLTRIEGSVVLHNSSNEGFLIGCNKAVAAAHGRTVLLLNSDAFVRPGALAAALQTLDADPDIGAVGGKLILPSGKLQEAGSIVWSDGSTLGYARGLDPNTSEAMFRRNVDYCSGAFLLTPRALWDQLGGFDKVFLPAYYEEVDYCMRLRDQGYRVVYEPQAVIDHFEFGSESKSGTAVETMLRNREQFKNRHLTALQQRHLSPSDANTLNARTDPPAERRRLLVIDNEVPLGALGSGYPRMRELLNEAHMLGWAVTLFPLNVPAVNWDLARREIFWDIEIAADRGLQGLPNFLSERQGYYDVILISRPDNMRLVHEACWDRMHVFDDCRLVYDAEALFSTRDIIKAKIDGVPIGDPEALINTEISLAQGVSAILCVTPAEAETFRSRVAAPTYVLSHPTTVSAVASGFSGREGFLFVGRLLEREAPNWQGLLWFIRNCWPQIHRSLKGVTLTVAGHLSVDQDELKAPGVRLLGSVDNLGPLYDGARIFLAPIRFAAGVPIKILEATAAGLPTAGTRLMAHQLAWHAGVEMVAEDDPAALTNAIIELYGDEAEWNRMRNAAQNRIRQEHGAASFRSTLRAVLDGSPSLSHADKTDALA